MQPPQRISEAERRFLLDGIAQGMRNDGRGCYDCRRVTFELGVVPSAASSCRLRAGETDLVVAVKCDMGKPAPHRPDAGQFQIVVDCAASVSFQLMEGWNSEDWGRRLSILVETLCAGEDVVDRRALSVAPGVFAWDVHVDVLVFASGGNLLDSISLALCAALGETLLPKVVVEEAMEEGEHTQLRVDDRPEVGTPFPLRKKPLCVTVAQFRDRFLLDATSEEESCTDGMLCVVVDAMCGDIMGLHKLSRGLLDVACVPDVLERCRATAAALSMQLDTELSMGAAAAVKGKGGG